MDKKNHIDAESVRSLALLLKETGVTEIEYQLDSLRIRVAKSATVTNTIVSPTHAAQFAIPQPSACSTSPTIHEESRTAQKPEKDLGEQNPCEEEQFEAIKSPMVGVVYVAPSPDEQPFVKVGDEVKDGQTLLVIEAMKVMNLIKSPKNGVVKKILVQDRQPVEFDEPLIVIE